MVQDVKKKTPLILYAPLLNAFTKQLQQMSLVHCHTEEQNKEKTQNAYAITPIQQLIRKIRKGKIT